MRVVRSCVVQCCLLVVGCSAGDSGVDSEQPSAASSALGASPLAAGTPKAISHSPCASELAFGDWSYASVNHTYALSGTHSETVAALCGNSIDKARLLVELGAREGFSVSGADQVGGQFSGWVTGNDLDDLIRQLLGNKRFQLGFVPTPTGHRLSELVVEPAAVAAAGLPTDDFVGVVSAQQQSRWQSDYGELALGLADENEAVRFAAIDLIGAEGEGLSVLAQALAGEKSPDLRIALLEKLDESGSVIALQTMLRYLHDPDPGVVTTSIELIADWHDEELVLRHVHPLLQHDAAIVREAALQAINRFR